MNRLVAGELLRERGITVDEAEDGAIAWQMVARADYDAVVMDVQMPVMDGLRATAAIRGDDRLRDVPIIALTANASSEE